MGLFETIFYQPLYNLLVLLYDLMPWGGIGLAIIGVTVIVKGVLFPLTFKTLRAQKELQEIQPQINEVREKYKDDKEKQAKELMAIYKEHNVNPFASCLPLLVQLPIFLALFRVLQAGVGEVNQEMLYTFVRNPGVMDTIFLGIFDLAKVSIPLALLTAVAQYFQVKQTMRKRVPPTVRKESGAMDEDMAAQMNRMMLYFMPGLTLIVGLTSLPGGVMLYWLVTTILTVILYKLFLSNKTEEVKT